jgi:pyruvate/2-oxoglutarate dehydrogenase complex dihydrolipoamide dehydrogenase (E3) component
MSGAPGNVEEFDVVIIGAGQAGVPLSRALAQWGKRIVLVERKHLGGSCVNFGCIPTKAAIASARVAHLARRGNEFGLDIPIVAVNFAAVIERAGRISRESRDGLRKGFESTQNPLLIYGQGHIDGREGERFRIRVGETVLLAEQVVIDTGTRTLIPLVPGLKDLEFIHSGNWLEHKELPRNLLMIGGGYISLEMAQFYRRMGSEVTVIEQSGQIAGHEDRDVADALQKLLEAEGINFRLNTHINSVMKNASGIEVVVKVSDREESLMATDLFVAIGRLPNTDDLGLETVEVKVSERGIIEVDKRLATNVPGIWAAGDVRGGPMFTHTSWDDYRILLSQMAGDGSRTTDRIVPYAVFTDPELGRVGMTEAEARKAGYSIKVSHFEMRRNGKAIEIGEPSGFIKVIIDAGNGQILGAAVLANKGAELVHMYIDVMNANVPYTVIRDAIHIHPTLAEAVQSAVSEFKETGKVTAS